MKLRVRRKKAEEIMAWKKKLDAEEAKIREMEKKAHKDLSVSHSVVSSLTLEPEVAKQKRFSQATDKSESKTEIVTT